MRLKNEANRLPGKNNNRLMYSLILVGFNRFLLIFVYILKRNQRFSVSKCQKYVFVKNKTLSPKGLFKALELVININKEQHFKKFFICLI